eukprot:5994_1
MYSMFSCFARFTDPNDQRACAISEVSIYIIGGSTKMNGQGALKSIERFDCVTQSWSRMPDMHEARRGASSVSFDQRIYVFGGFDGSNNLNTVERYDPKAD